MISSRKRELRYVFGMPFFSAFSGSPDSRLSVPRQVSTNDVQIITGLSTTLSLSQFDFFQLQHPFEIVRLRHEKVRGQHLLDDGSHAWQRQVRLSASAAFVLQKAVGDGCQDDVTLPPRQSATFEVIESDLVFEFLIRCSMAQR